MNFAEKLQGLRKQRNISQEQLAEQMHVTRQAVSKWELGESLPDVDNIVRLSEILDVSLDYLMKDDVATDTNGGNYSSVADVLDPVESDVSSIKRLEKAINPLATLIFLALGFLWGMWHPGWIVFVVAWVFKRFLKYSRTGKIGVSLDDAACAAFVIVGFIFDMWNLAIFIIIAAWVVEEAISPEKEKKKKKKKHIVEVETLDDDATNG